jgi:hypothetical protein
MGAKISKFRTFVDTVKTVSAVLSKAGAGFFTTSLTFGRAGWLLAPSGERARAHDQHPAV